MKYKNATTFEIDHALKNADAYYQQYKHYDKDLKARFLETIAIEIDALEYELIETAMRETNLSETRLTSERARTVAQLRLFAHIVSEGNWVDATWDTAMPDRQPNPKPDLRTMLMGLGAVVVFGTSSFPFAFSTIGSDTVSALAAGCPVIVKAHPAHAATSTLMAEAIQSAAQKCNLSASVFQHLYGDNNEVSKNLVQHPLTKAVAFTGSFAAGKTVLEWANQRPVPIPVFAEMGSLNPVIVMPQIMRENAPAIARTLASAVVYGMGQFCTSPGLILAIDSVYFDHFMHSLNADMTNTVPMPMLNQNIITNYAANTKIALTQKGVRLEAKSKNIALSNQVTPMIALTSGQEFIKNPILHKEIFGPYALVVRCKNWAEMEDIIEYLEGQLTTTVLGLRDELLEHQHLFQKLENICGRIVVNGIPTTIELGFATQHGGPYPATNDARFTSVGAAALKRFARPICYQGFPNILLPKALQNDNPLQIWRQVNGIMTKD